MTRVEPIFRCCASLFYWNRRTIGSRDRYYRRDSLYCSQYARPSAIYAMLLLRQLRRTRCARYRRWIIAGNIIRRSSRAVEFKIVLVRISFVFIHNISRSTKYNDYNYSIIFYDYFTLLLVSMQFRAFSFRSISTIIMNSSSL